jgi:hypothetical protein
LWIVPHYFSKREATQVATAGDSPMSTVQKKGHTAAGDSPM